MISIVELIIMIVVVSICAAAIAGTLVYCILKKKHDEDIEWLFNMICTNKTEVDRFYNKYWDHLVDYHEQEDIA
jgi:hypothetical protein